MLKLSAFHWARTRSAFTCDFACATRMVAGWGMKCLVLRAEEEVVGRIRHENLVTHIAGD